MAILCVFLKRSLSGYHTQGNLPAYTKFFTGKNVLDIQQLQANQIDINSRARSHLLGSPAQGCVRARRAEETAARCLPGRLPQGPGKGPGVAGPGQEGSDAASWTHRASLEARGKQRGSKGEAGFLCEFYFQPRIVSFTPHRQPLPSVPGRNDDFQLDLAAHS